MQKVNQLFGSATKNVHQMLYLVEDLFSKENEDIYVSLAYRGDTSVEDADIIIVDGVDTLVSVDQYLNENMVVIICDSIVNLLRTNSAPLDYEVNYNMTIKYFDVVEAYITRSMNTNHDSVVPIVNKDITIATVIERVATEGMILKHFNKVQSYLDQLARNQIRSFLSKLLTNQISIEAFAKEVNKMANNSAIKTEIKSFYTVLAKHVPVLQRCMSLIIDKGYSPVRVAKQFSAQEFELVFLHKLILSSSNGRSSGSVGN